MPIELATWRIDNEIKKLPITPMKQESRLQEIIAKDISIVDQNLLIIGREVQTIHDKFIDILAINSIGSLVVIELKRDKTPRDIVAQVLDYGSWVRTLRNEDIAKIFTDYQRKYMPQDNEVSIDEAFCKKFSVKSPPDELNETHELVIVTSQLDASTERIVQYLAEEYDVKINVVYFHVFQDDDREYLSRVWLREPDIDDEINSEDKDRVWNGEYYVSYGADERKDWEEARKYGFINAGGGAWYIKTLKMLSVGDRIWVNIPGSGYVGVGTVTSESTPLDDFKVMNEKNQSVLLTSLDVNAKNHITLAQDEEKAEYFVGVKWIKTIPESEAVKEKGFFGNQNTVAKPKSAKWEFTIDRLKKKFQIE